jgi:putative protein-disulfide isomerase
LLRYAVECLPIDDRFPNDRWGLQERHSELSIEIVVGGSRAGATDILDDAGKRFRLEHWAKVEQASGLPFRDGEGWPI